MTQEIHIDATDAFFHKLLKAVQFHSEAALARGLASPDALECAGAEILARIRVHTDEGKLSITGDGVPDFTTAEVRVFISGLVLGSYFERNGLSFSPKWCDKDLQ